MRALIVVMMLAAVAHADGDEAPAPAKLRPLHGSIAIGGAAVFGDADRWEGAAAIDVLPGGRFGAWGVTAGVRDVGYSPFGKRGVASIGIIREAAAARPLLAIFVHGDVGATWGDRTLPIVGGGVKTYLTAVGPLGVALDTTLHLEIDGVDGTHLVLGLGLLVAAIK